MREHVSIFNRKIYGRDYIDLILKGIKVADAKFSSKKSPPYNKLQAGDRVYLKESGKAILGHVDIKKAVSFELRGEDHVLDVLEKNKDGFAIETTAEFESIFAGRKDKKFCTLFYFVNPIRYTKPVPYSSRGRSSWVMRLK